MHLSDSEKGQVAGSCEHVTEPLSAWLAEKLLA
jgi:hypothetical protein